MVGAHGREIGDLSLNDRYQVIDQLASLYLAILVSGAAAFLGRLKTALSGALALIIVPGRPRARSPAVAAADHVALSVAWNR